MPRKNLKRKNANSNAGQSGVGGGGGGSSGGRRRKSKPIKFNPNDIENEQKLLLDALRERDNDVHVATDFANEMDANDGDDKDDDDDVQHNSAECSVEKMQLEQEMQSINGSDSIQVNRNNSEMTMPTPTAAIVATGSTDNACRSNQMDKIDDRQNENDAAAATDANKTKWDGFVVKSDSPLSSRTFNYFHFRFEFYFVCAFLLSSTETQSNCLLCFIRFECIFLLLSHIHFSKKKNGYSSNSACKERKTFTAFTWICHFD